MSGWPSGSVLGRGVLRREDRSLLTGEARFLEDVPATDALHVAFVRASVAHARIRGVDADAAGRHPGVVGVFTADDLGLRPLPPGTRVPPAFSRPPLAASTVRFVGEPVAVVVAESREAALDASEAVVVDLDPVPAVPAPVRALEADAPLLFPEAGTNVARESTFGTWEDALEGSDVVVRARLVNQRLAPVPMEPNGILAVPQADGGLTVWAPHQAPHFLRDELAKRLPMEADRIRVRVPAVGGGFGAKAALYPEQLVAAALARRLGRPIRWIETRSENLLSMTHGRAQVQDVEVGARRDGTLTGLRLRVVADMGAYPVGTYLPGLTRQMASGVYRIPRIAFRAASVVTTTTPIESYRGAGRPEAAAAVERAMDLLARELGMDPVDLRRRNLIAADDFPHTTAVSTTYDSGDFERALDRVLQVASYERLRSDQAARRTRGARWQLGIGVSTYVEITAWGSEYGEVEVHPDGTATARTGVAPHGQGHETAFAQLVAGSLGMPMEAVRVQHSDTALVRRGEGTMGSRSLQLGGSALFQAAEAVLAKARHLVGHLLEVSPHDVTVFAEDGGRVGVVGAPHRSFSWAELARIARDPPRLQEPFEPGLWAEADFDYDDRNTFPFGAHISVVEVDVETGAVRPLRHVTVDDCGRILNPVLVRGQQHGGIAQGIAQALYEEVRYDADANPLTGSLLLYAMPGAPEFPSFEASTMETPTPLNPLGAKGIGESGTVGSTPAVQSAVVDALSHLGVRHVDLPLSPERVWRAIREASGNDRTR